MRGYDGIWLGIWGDMLGYDIQQIALLLRDMVGYVWDMMGYDTFGIW